MKNVTIFIAVLFFSQNTFSLDKVNKPNSYAEEETSISSVDIKSIPPTIKYFFVNKDLPSEIQNVSIYVYFEREKQFEHLNSKNSSTLKRECRAFSKILLSAIDKAKTSFKTVILGYDKGKHPAKVINNCIFNIKYPNSFFKDPIQQDIPEISLKTTALSSITVVVYPNYVLEEPIGNADVICFSDFNKTSMLAKKSSLWLLKTFLIDNEYTAIDVKTGQTRRIPMAYSDSNDLYSLKYSNIITSLPYESLKHRIIKKHI